MIIDISEDGRTIEWWSNGERKITTIDHLIDVYDGIVRCKDCKLFDPEHEGGIGSCGLDMNVTANDYCSKAERKDEGNTETLEASACKSCQNQKTCKDAPIPSRYDCLGYKSDAVETYTINAGEV